MNLVDFKDLAAGIESIAIVIAALVGGAWAVFQFFSLRAVESAKLELEKKRKELVERGSIVTELVTETFTVEGSFYLHVRVVMKNIGSGVDVVDWSKATMFARRFYKVEEVKLAVSEQALLGWRAPSAVPVRGRLMPGYTTGDSFLIPIPQVGVYYVEFTMPVSQTVMSETINDLGKTGAKPAAESFIIWRADTFVSVPTHNLPAAPP